LLPPDDDHAAWLSSVGHYPTLSNCPAPAIPPQFLELIRARAPIYYPMTGLTRKVVLHLLCGCSEGVFLNPLYFIRHVLQASGLRSCIRTSFILAVMASLRRYRLRTAQPNHFALHPFSSRTRFITGSFWGQSPNNLLAHASVELFTSITLPCCGPCICEAHDSSYMHQLTCVA